MPLFRPSSVAAATMISSRRMDGIGNKGNSARAAIRLETVQCSRRMATDRSFILFIACARAIRFRVDYDGAGYK